MKTKTIQFSNFEYSYLNSSDNINKLFIDSISNVNTNNGYIQSELSINDLLFELFDNINATNIQENNENILSKTIKLLPYEFINEINNQIQIRLFAISVDNILFELNLETNLFEEKYIFAEYKNDVVFNNILYIFDLNNKCVTIENDNILMIENIPNIDSFVFNDNKLYFSIKGNSNKLYISDNQNLKDISTNLDEFTSINIPIEDGLICKIVNIKKQVYVITQYSIFKINEDELIIQKQNNIESLIYRNSINQVDDAILFYSENGLYSFDGTDIKLIFNNFLNIDKNAIFVIFNQKLYILTSNSQNILFVFNLNSNQFTFVKIDNIKYIFKINTYSYHKFCLSYKEDESLKIISIYSDKNADVLTQNIKFKPLFLSTNNLKQIQSIAINSTGDFSFKVSSDISSSVFNISNSVQLSNISLNGNYFIFEITSNSKFKLNSILLTYSEIGE